MGEEEFIPALINGSPMYLLFDTGATICTISQSMVQQLGLQHFLQPCNTELDTTGGGLHVTQQLIANLKYLGAQGIVGQNLWIWGQKLD
jgi:predicted aspartyl protease